MFCLLCVALWLIKGYIHVLSQGLRGLYLRCQRRPCSDVFSLCVFMRAIRFVCDCVWSVVCGVSVCIVCLWLSLSVSVHVLVVSVCSPPVCVCVSSHHLHWVISGHCYPTRLWRVEAENSPSDQTLDCSSKVWWQADSDLGERWTKGLAGSRDLWACNW